MNRVETFTAWRRPADAMNPEGIPIPIENPAYADDALAAALAYCSRGDTLFIRADNALTGKSMVRIYTVQQGKKPQWEPGCAPNRPGPMIAKFVTDMRCAAFEPVEPFNAMKRGADHVNGSAGHYRMMLEGRAA